MDTYSTLGRWRASLAKFPSFGFGLAYLASIPLFAFVYTHFPFDFYDSTARYEATVVRQGEAIADRLRQTFLADARGTNPDRPTVNGAPILEHDRFPTFWLQFSPDHTRVMTMFLVNNGTTNDVDFIRVGLDLDENSILHGEQDPSKINSWFSTKVFYADVRAANLSDFDVQLPLLFPCGKFRGPTGTCLKMTLDDYSLLLSLNATAAGQPTRAQSSFFRMLYFSAVTSSTLGYGDIVPVTSRMRGVVTFQVILGPLMFALFLNSLVTERSLS